MSSQPAEAEAPLELSDTPDTPSQEEDNPDNNEEVS